MKIQIQGGQMSAKSIKIIDQFFNNETERLNEIMEKSSMLLNSQGKLFSREKIRNVEDMRAKAKNMKFQNLRNM